MRRIRLLFLQLLMYGIGFSSQVLADSDCRVLTATAHPEAPPVMWREGDHIKGIGPDVLIDVSKQIGVSVHNLYVGPWKRALRNLERGEVDLITSLYKTPQREKIYDYSIPFMEDPVVVFSLKRKGFEYSGWADLIDEKGAATLGDSYGESFDHFIETKLDVQRVSSYMQLFKLLREGRITYGIGPLYTIKAHVNQQKFNDFVTIHTPLVTTEKMYMAMGKSGSCTFLLPKINAALKQLKESGRIDAVITRVIQRFSDDS